jgi:hypothetical protein
MSLYKALTGSERDPAAEGEHWEGVGFQGRRPSSDLRGMGMLSLLNALHLVTRRKRLAAELFALSRSERDFPFMSVSINLTKVCVDALRCGALTSAANAAGSLVEVFHELHAGLFAHMGEQWRARKLGIMVGSDRCICGAPPARNALADRAAPRSRAFCVAPARCARLRVACAWPACAAQVLTRCGLPPHLAHPGPPLRTLTRS